MDSRNRKKKVILFLPLGSGNRHFTNQKVPLEILSLAGLLIKNGYHVVLIDAYIRKSYKDEIINNCNDAFCLGISCIFGYQVYDGTTIARLVREKFPDLPIVFGGWFPTVKPELFLNEGLADVVVRGQGEETFLELVESYRHETSLKGVLGITYKKEGHIITNPNRPLTKLDDLPPIPYHLISDDIECYIKADQDCKQFRSMLAARKGSSYLNCELRILWYFSSYGCPDNCNFCCSPGVTKRRWVAKDAVKVVDEIEGLIEKYSYNVLYFVDANFFVNENRVKRFCEEIIRRRVTINWYAMGEAHSIVNYNKETLDLMSESCCFLVLLGGEAACEKTLHMLNKNIKAGDVEKSISALTSHKISAEVSYVIGYPDESSDSIEATIEECRRIKMKYPTIDPVIRHFTPLPGSAFFVKALQLGYKEPKFPDGYRQFIEDEGWNRKNTGWVKKHQTMKVNRYRYLYFKWAYDIFLEKPRLNLLQKILNKSALFRIKHKITVLPIEFRIYYLAARISQRLRHLFDGYRKNY